MKNIYFILSLFRDDLFILHHPKTLLTFLLAISNRSFMLLCEGEKIVWYVTWRQASFESGPRTKMKSLVMYLSIFGIKRKQNELCYDKNAPPSLWFSFMAVNSRPTVCVIIRSMLFQSSTAVRLSWALKKLSHTFWNK